MRRPHLQGQSGLMSRQAARAQPRTAGRWRLTAPPASEIQVRRWEQREGWEEELPEQKPGAGLGAGPRRPGREAGGSSDLDGEQGRLLMPGCGEPRKGLKQESDLIDWCLLKVKNDLGSC